MSDDPDKKQKKSKKSSKDKKERKDKKSKKDRHMSTEESEEDKPQTQSVEKIEVESKKEESDEENLEGNKEKIEQLIKKIENEKDEEGSGDEEQEKGHEDSFHDSAEQIKKIKGSVKLKERKKTKLKKMLTQNHMLLTVKDKAPNLEISTKDTSPTWASEREALILLLHSRILLKNLVQIKLKNDRIKRGDLNVGEVQGLLHSQKEDMETDWVAEIQELKRNLVNEVRKNHKLENELTSLDKRISLLIKNKNQIQELAAPKKRPLSVSLTNEISSDPKKLTAYSNLFYLLQTNPQYLANLVILIAPDQMDAFLETVILTLFGDVFSPREEYLLLSLFGLSIRKEMKTFKSALDFQNKGDSVVPKMIITYNKRKQGLEFVTHVIAPVIKKIIETSNKKKIDLELRPKQVFQKWLSDTEIQTGQKAKYDRNMEEAEILKIPEIVQLLKGRTEQLIDWSKKIADVILSNFGEFPYGLRWICKEIKTISLDLFPKTAERDIFKLMANFIYFKYLNITIVSPDQFGLVEEKELTPVTIRNLVQIAQVLQYLFSFNSFTEKQTKHLSSLNSWLKENEERVEDFFRDVIDVTEPEEHLKVDKYIEFTQKTKPLIVISLREMALTHQILLKNVEKVASPKQDDPLRLVLKELGKVPEVSKEDNRELQLTLQNRFADNVPEPDAGQVMYAETKEMIITSFRQIPVQQANTNEGLVSILKMGLNYAVEKKDSVLEDTIKKILRNMEQLVKKELINADDNYAAFLRDIALEVANRAEARELQRKEIKRLTQSLRNLRTHQKYLTDQIQYWEEYLQNVLHKQAAVDPKKKKKKKTTNNNNNTITHTFSYANLQKQGVIISSDVPQLVRKKTNFVISTSKIGVFEIECKISNATVEKITIELDDLLERNFNNITRLELDQVVLDVNLTIHLINKFFMK